MYLKQTNKRGKVKDNVLSGPAAFQWDPAELSILSLMWGK